MFETSDLYKEDSDPLYMDPSSTPSRLLLPLELLCWLPEDPDPVPDPVPEPVPDPVPDPVSILRLIFEPEI